MFVFCFLRCSVGGKKVTDVLEGERCTEVEQGRGRRGTGVEQGQGRERREEREEVKTNREG